MNGGGSGYYEFGEEIVLTAEPERCHRFVGWYTDSNAQGVMAKGDKRKSAIDGLRLLTTDRTYTHSMRTEARLYPVFHRMGDVNGDKHFTISDVVLEANFIMGQQVGQFMEEEADANGDGEVTIADVVEIANSVMTK